MRTFVPWLILVLLVSAGALWLGNQTNTNATAQDLGKSNIGLISTTHSNVILQHRASPQPDVSALDKFLDKNNPQRFSGTVLSEIRLVDEEDTAKIVAVLHDKEEDDAVRNEAIQVLRRARAPGLSATLAFLLDEPSEKARFRSFLVQGLGDVLVDERRISSPNSATAEVIIGFVRQRLIDRHREVRREALLALVDHQDAVGLQYLARPLADPAWDGMRDLAIRLLGTLPGTERLPEVRPYTYDADERTRIAAIAYVGEKQDLVSLPAVQEAIQSPVLRLQRAGTLALKRMMTPLSATHALHE